MKPFWNTIKHFTPNEMEDPTGENMNEEFMILFEAMRVELDCPIRVYQGFGLKGHSKKSYHGSHDGSGRAADWTPLGKNIVECLPIVIKYFNGIGIYPYWKPKAGFHIDNRDTEKIMWIRDISKKYHYWR